MSVPKNSVYFILTKQPNAPRHASAGSLCYASKSEHQKLSSANPPKKLSVVFLKTKTGLDYPIDMAVLEELSLEEAKLLSALPSDGERLEWFSEGAALKAALGLTLGTPVTVEEDGKTLRGCVRFIGEMTNRLYGPPLPGTFFGIELQGADRGKGKSDGTYDYTALFTCQKKCGVFAPFTRVRPLVPSSLSPSSLSPSSLSPPAADPAPEPEGLHPGDRVTYFIDDECRHGMVVNVQEEEGQQMVNISTDTDETGKRGGEVKVPLMSVAKGELPAESDSMDVDTPPEAAAAPPYSGLSAAAAPYSGLSQNSVVEVSLSAGNAYGIIRWVGSLPGMKETMAGLELEEEVGVSDGTFKLKRYFDCPPKRALFVKLSSCRPDSRFQSFSSNHGDIMPNLDDAEMEADVGGDRLETVPPISSEQVEQLLVGRMKGIQGHYNSCYMDAALFGLFSCSSVLDSMLFKRTPPEDAAIQQTLLRHIVNPLRSKGFVEGRHIMKLRQQLQKHGYSHSFTTDEKDPEEFLLVIMHHILALDPLLRLSAGGKVQDGYCYQIFLDQNHQLVLPTVQQLLEHSFHSAGLKLAEVPSCLILQMPRFGKKFKMFDKIIPSLELDVTDLLCEGPQQCILCGDLALEECADCFKDPVFSTTGFKVFCRSCSAQVHGHPQRRSHSPAALSVPRGYQSSGAQRTLSRDKLELFAVLCIETSHYVSFVKHGPNAHDWIFFDSMADRQGERDGFNIPEVQPCPEVGAYLEMTPAELANQAPRDMKGVAKRLFCDAYMYLYQSASMCLYR